MRPPWPAVACRPVRGQVRRPGRAGRKGRRPCPPVTRQYARTASGQRACLTDGLLLARVHLAARGRRASGLGVAPERPGILNRMITRRARPRFRVTVEILRAGGLRDWGVAAGAFERRVAAVGSPAVIIARAVAA